MSITFTDRNIDITEITVQLKGSQRHIVLQRNKNTQIYLWNVVQTLSVTVSKRCFVKAGTNFSTRTNPTMKDPNI